MTTIAYHKPTNTIAYDSRSCAGALIISDKTNKHVVKNGVHFFFCGACLDIPKLVEAYLDGADMVEINEGTQAFVFDKGKLLKVATDDKDCIWKDPIDYSFAMGSGMEFALTAMDLGCDAVAAVKMAAKRDVHTGGAVKSFKLEANMGGCKKGKKPGKK